MVGAMLAGGSRDVYEAGRLYAGSKVMSGGRKNELEADESGAEYMAKLGYDTEEMISMISILKDNEIMQRAQAKTKGALRPSYHGVFSSHPRNDSRLRALVSKGRLLTSDIKRSNGADIYRKLTHDLIWGQNFLDKETPPERYSNLDWRVRFDLPEGWTQASGAAPVMVTGSEPEGLATLTMTRLARTAQSPEEYLYNQLNFTAVTDGAEITPARLKGFSGILKQPTASDKSGRETAKKSVRIAVIYYKLSAYMFRGEVLDGNDFAEQDELFVNAISSFRPISRAEIAGQKPLRVRYVKATSNTTFAGIAKKLKLSKKAIETLRIINGLYPGGEPVAGDIIKVFMQ